MTGELDSGSPSDEGPGVLDFLGSTSIVMVLILISTYIWNRFETLRSIRKWFVGENIDEGSTFLSSGAPRVERMKRE